ncbi:MAG TPA: TetR/AcrR family transcriptional regulator [Ruania sp.]|nr:TetR/AcrR family transcriptional regulator [Ruania sp.]
MAEARTRRRGAELEAALLSAAWDQLVAEGYGRFTFEAIAERAGTSKPVLYRRWSTREELLRAALRHRGAATVPEVPDTGSLREDLKGSLLKAAAGSEVMTALASALISSHFGEIGMTPAELRAELLGSRPTSIEQILQRAVERQEVDPSLLTPRLVDLPFTLFRHEYLMTFTPPDEAAIEEFLDQIVLPLLTGGRRNARAGDSAQLG